MRLRFYKNGKLKKSKVSTMGVRAVDNIEKDWRESLGNGNPTSPTNSAVDVTRVSEQELIVINDFGDALQWKLVD